MLLKDKVAVVTGAARGVGREIALLMARQGAHVVVNDYGGSEVGLGADRKPADEVVDEIRRAGGQAAANYDSVATMAGGQAIVKAALDAFGRVDLGVNNAGILRDRMIVNMHEEEWDGVIDTHLKATALDMARYNVTANCISPFAWTRMIGTIPTETEAQKARVEKIKKLSPAHIAPVAAFLATDAAKDITGQVFGVRGKEIMLFSHHRPVRRIHDAEGWTVEKLIDI